jgi:chemotaxis protein MotB
MAKIKKTERKIRPPPAWMLSFTDLTQQLLIFFVLLFSMSEVSKGELQQILSSFKGSFGLMTGGLTLSKGMLAELGQMVETLPSRERGEKLSKAVEKAMSMFQPEVKSRKVKITEDERGVIISLVTDAFFESGSPNLTPEGEATIAKIGRFLRDPMFATNNIRVEGHTDNTQIPPGSRLRVLYPTNWELSSARATKVVRVLNEEYGITGRNLQAIGYGEYQPVESNDIEEGRAYNRRIEIIVMRKKEYS